MKARSSLFRRLVPPALLSILLVAGFLAPAAILRSTPELRREATRAVPVPVFENAGSSSDPKRSDQAVESPASRYRPGDVFLYGFRARSAAVSEQRGDLGPDAEGSLVRIDSELGGSLEILVREERPDGWAMTFRFSDIELSASSPAGPVTADSNQPAAMETEVLAVIERSGMIRRLGFRSETPRDARDAIKALLARTQVILPDDETIDRWEVIENDPTGACIVAYRRRATEAGPELSKRKERYVAIFNSGGLEISEALDVDGETKILLAGGFPSRIAGRESLWLESEKVLGSVGVEEEFSFELRSRRFDPRVAARAGGRFAEARGLEWEDFGPAARSSSLGDRAIELEGELARAEDLFSEEMPASPEAVECFARIVEALENDPEGARTVLEFLRERTENVSLWASLLGALGSAGTGAAQSALEEVIEGEWPDPMRETALIALAHVEKPAERLDPLLEVLHAEEPSLSVNALLVLAAVGDRVREGNAERFARIEEYVLAAADLETARAETAPAALEAIGNLGPKATPSSVAAAYYSGDEVARISAVRAVRKTFDRAAETLLRDAVSGDPSEEVRAAAIGVIAERGKTDMLRDAAFRDPSETVRRRAIEDLGRSVRRDSGLRDAIAWVAAHDGSEDVRKAARRALGDEPLGAGPDDVQEPLPSGSYPASPSALEISR